MVHQMHELVKHSLNFQLLDAKCAPRRNLAAELPDGFTGLQFVDSLFRLLESAFPGANAELETLRGWADGLFAAVPTLK